MVLFCCAAGIWLAWCIWPRQVDMRQFNPVEMGDRETRMWMHYYDKRYTALLIELYLLARRQFGFSPADCLRLGYRAARAAQRFQISDNRDEARTAIPDLRRYYTLIAKRTQSAIDVCEAARLELEWWQQRRENATTEQVAQTMAELAGHVYAVPPNTLLESSRLKAETMAYRDKRDGGAMTEHDWQYVRTQLRDAYEAAHGAVATAEPPR
jgi:hypothetical protein